MWSAERKPAGFWLRYAAWSLDAACLLPLLLLLGKPIIDAALEQAKTAMQVLQLAMAQQLDNATAEQSHLTMTLSLLSDPRTHAGVERLSIDELLRVGEEALDGSRAGVHGRFLAHRQSGRGPVHAEDMPRRVIVFGISNMPAQALEALAALATTAQVLLCVHNPSMHLWSDARPERELWRSA